MTSSVTSVGFEPQSNKRGSRASTVHNQNGEVLFDLYDQEAISGEEQLRQIAAKTYSGTQSFSSLLFRKRGSVIVRVLPVSLFGGFLAYCMVMTQINFNCPKPNQLIRKPDSEYSSICWGLPELKHPFVVQIFGIILSFVIVARNNVAVDRYFHGMESVHTMSSRWVDSFTSLMGFLRSSIDLHPPNSKKQEACVAIGLAMLHWGTLAHALAMNSLQATQLGIDEGMWEHRLSTLEPPSNLTLDSEAAYDTATKTKTKLHRSRSRAVKGAMTADKRVSITDTGIVKEKVSNATMRELGKLGVYGPVSQDEKDKLHGATDKVAIVLMWMEEAISRGQVQGIILTAPPILGRVYNEIGAGLEGFNHAFRIALVPFPFCFSQLIGWCLVIFVFLCPIVAYVFTGGEILTSCLTFFSLMGFWGLNRIAIELENPFGCEVNHLPLAELHHAYVEALGEMHVHPMPEYRWNTGQGVAMPTLRRTLANK